MTSDAIPRAKLQDLIDAVNREGGWRDTDTVAELLTQFLDAEGFDLTSPPRVIKDGSAAALSVDLKPGPYGSVPVPLDPEDDDGMMGPVL